MTSQGSAHGRFTRAIKQGNLFAAELAAREMGGLALDSALDFIVLIAKEKPERFERAALRWHGRLELEATTLTLEESQFALAALARLRIDPTAAALLKTLVPQARPTLMRRF
jgi:hypothetical protein